MKNFLGKHLESIIVILGLLLLGLMLSAVLYSAYISGRDKNECSKRCGIVKSMPLDRSCYCMTNDGWVKNSEL